MHLDSSEEWWQFRSHLDLHLPQDQGWIRLVLHYHFGDRGCWVWTPFCYCSSSKIYCIKRRHKGSIKRHLNLTEGYVLPDFSYTGNGGPCAAVTKTIIHTDSENSYSDLELNTTTDIVRPRNQDTSKNYYSFRVKLGGCGATSIFGPYELRLSCKDAGV